jgi:hypothetical protein
MPYSCAKEGRGRAEKRPPSLPPSLRGERGGGEGQAEGSPGSWNATWRKNPMNAVTVGGGTFPFPSAKCRFSRR